MTPVWHDGPLADLCWDGTAPVAWRATTGGGGVAADRARALVAHLAGVGAASVRLGRSTAGAPRVLAPHGWYVGLSHRGGECLIGAAMQPVAVDRELIDDAPPLWDMLTHDEAVALRRLGPAAQPRAWLRIWTIKEAHAKLVGEPRRLAPEAIETRLVDATRSTARCEGMSRGWTRDDGVAIETLAIWAREGGTA